MSDQNNTNDTQPLGTEPVISKPTRETTSVPLRKETVRVTLKSTPAGAKRPAAPTPPAARPPAARPPMPSAPKPAAMTKDTGPQAPAPPAARNSDIPDVTSAVPLKQETMRVTLKADAPKAAPAPAAKAPAPAAKAPAPAAKAPAPAASQQPTASLPKATVELQQTQQLSAGPSMATPGAGATFQTTTVEDDSEEKDTTTIVTVLSIVALVFAIILLLIQFQGAKVWVDKYEDGSYGAIFSSSE